MKESEQQGWIKQLKKLQHPTPFKVTDLRIAKQKALDLRTLLPQVEKYYAVKSCTDAELILAVDKLVDGYDIASIGELEVLTSLGIESSRILYSNPVKVPSHIKAAYNRGVRYFAFDSLDEIHKLAENAPGSNVYLRVKVSDYGSKFPLSKKFGIDPLHAVAYAGAAVEAGLNMCGLAFHVGSQSENTKAWEAAIETSGQLIKKLEAAGVTITMLNIGGGFPVTYTQPAPSASQTATIINRSLKKHIPDSVRIVCEPGRYISAESSVIVSSVIAREHRGSSDWLYLDMGVFQGLMEPLEMHNWQYPVFTDFGKKSEVFSQPFVLTGPTCDAYDTIGLDYMLPSSMKVGNRVYIGVVGAYSGVYASNFNGFEPPKTYYINKRILNFSRKKYRDSIRPKLARVAV